jgi:hypothetical protein
MTHSKRQKQQQPRQQRGGMKLGESVKAALVNSGNAITDTAIIRLLISNADSIRVVSDWSTYSFVFELTLRSHTLMNTFGLSLNESADVPANDALGTPVHNLCAKISFVSRDKLMKEYNGVTKSTVTEDKANQEARILGELFETFACRRTTAPFVPDVIAHANLGGPEFRAMFEGLKTPPEVERILDWINDWIETSVNAFRYFFTPPLRADVLLMEMIDVERSAPRVQQFQTVYSLRRRNPEAYEKATLRMIAEIAAILGIKILSHDSHLDNGLSTPDGEQGFLIDLGGTFDLRRPSDMGEILSFFGSMVDRCLTSSESEEIRAQRLLSELPSTANDGERALTKFPSIEDMCGFFESPFDADDRKKSITQLRTKFQENIDRIVNFMCEAPTPENVHHTLMMLGFLDFMINRMHYTHPYCQCRGGLSSVYSSHTFLDFRDFLNTFRVQTLPEMPTKLPDVVHLISEIVAPCPQYCERQPITLRPNWQERREAARVAEAARQEAERQEAARVAEAARQEAERQEAARVAEAARQEAERQEAERQEAARLAKIPKSRRSLAQRKIAKKKSNAQSATKSVKGIEKTPVESKPVAAVAVQQLQTEPTAPIPKRMLRLSSPNPLYRFNKKGGTRKIKTHHRRHNKTRRRHGH